jgi:hypothetical protein
MKTLPIPDTDQINAMLDDSVYDLVCEYIENPSQYNLKKYLTIDRGKLVDFLVQNTGKAETYFQKHASTAASHDVEQIWEEGSEYLVASMDHGKPRSIRRFATLPEAVAEHVLVTYGMY